MKKIFDADDWGLSPNVNEGILKLAERGLLHSVACLANTDYLTYGLDRLLALADETTFSLHFNLTELAPLSQRADVASLINLSTGTFHSHRTLLWKAWRNAVDRSAIAAEFDQQLARLRDQGIPVTEVDGHHHVHLIPAVYGAIQPRLKVHGLNTLRILDDPDHSWSYWQSLWFQKFVRSTEDGIHLRHCGYLLEKDFSRDAFLRKLTKYANSSLITHPAIDAGSGAEDSFRARRPLELKAILEHSI